MKKLFFQQFNIGAAKQPKEAMVVLNFHENEQKTEIEMACFFLDSAKMTDDEWHEMFAKHMDESITGIVAEEALHQRVLQAIQSHFPQHLPLLKKYQGKLTLVEDNKFYVSPETLSNDDALKRHMEERAQTPFAFPKEDEIEINAASFERAKRRYKENRRKGMLWAFIISLPMFFYFLYVLISQNAL